MNKINMQFLLGKGISRNLKPGVAIVTVLRFKITYDWPNSVNLSINLLSNPVQKLHISS